MRNYNQFFCFVLIMLMLVPMATASNYFFLKDSIVGRDFSDADMEILMKNIQLALNEGRKVTWKNPETGNGGVITPGKPAKWKGLDCRYTEILNSSRTRQSVTQYKFCKTAEGDWKVAPEK
jgi:hypothetical protein